MSDLAIQTERLVVRYRGKPALDGFTLAVPRGSVYALLGDNGAGKSTAMRVLTGQVRPDAGRATLLGLDCWSGAYPLRQRVGYVPDRPKLYDWMTVAEIGWFAAGFYAPGFGERFTRWSERLHLDGAKKLNALSKGGHARVGLALALAPNPEVLLLDEPTSGLDLITRREFLASLVEFAAEGKTVLISSHSIAELERAARHAGFVKGGKVVLAASLDDLRTKFRRVSFRYEGLLPDANALGRVHDVQRTGRSVQYLVEDLNAHQFARLGATPGVVDVEDEAVSLEEVYAAVMAHGDGSKPANVNGDTAMGLVESGVRS